MARRKENLQEVLPGFWQVMRHFGPYLRKRRGLMGGGLAMLFVSMAFRLLEPWPLKFIIDRVILNGPQNRSFWPAFLDGWSSTEQIVAAMVATVLIAVCSASAAYFSNVMFFVMGNQVVIKLRNDLYRHIQGLSLSFHRKSRGGDLIVRVTRDVNLLRDVTSTALLPLLASIVMLALMVAVMFAMQWRLTLVALTVIPLYWIATIRIGRKIRDSARKQRKREGAMASVAAEVLGAIDTVQALSLEGLFTEKFVLQNKSSQKDDLKANRNSARLGRTVDVLLAVSSAFVLGYGAKLAIEQQLSTGDLVVFLIYLRRAFRPAKDFAKYTARMAKATVAGERVLQLLQHEPEVRDRPDAIEAPAFRGDVSLENVHFSYADRHPVLRDVCLNVKPGGKIALVGPSGIGKSTLVGLIIRLYDTTDGRVLIDGRDVRDYTLASLRRQISVVPQDTTLFATSIWENIACGRDDIDAAEMEHATRLANAHDFISALPEGYDTVLGERGVTLSRGQRQRIAIARAAIRKAPLLILDEPMTGLDGASRQSVMEALERLVEDRTTILITHDLHLASRMDEILMLEEGRIGEQGTHDELIRSGGRYAHLFHARLATGAASEDLSRVIS
ncbi:MAG: ABC transporter ATP-binding protein [Planctomycetales bacterium]|nr:ABC transporter ATP-binding protein [Planctomycetales bacterium]